MTIGVVAPSNKVPSIELGLGIAKLRAAGLALKLHPQCRRHDFLFAGTDDERARAFFEYACDPRLEAIWCARGGYGAARLLPALDRLVGKKGPPPRRKLLIGYSDATILLEYVRARWGWAALHAPMPGMRKFCLQNRDEWESLLDFVRGERRPGVRAPWEKRRLSFVGGKAPRGAIEAELVGGNLSVWASLLGTPYAGHANGRMLFLEDVDESVYRLDRMMRQIWQAGGLQGVRAIVLGNFQGCADNVARVLAWSPEGDAELRELLTEPAPEDLRPLRRKFDARRAIHRAFGEIAAALRIPLAYGLPAGHGPGLAALPIGAKYRLGRDGTLELRSWDWLD